MTNPSSERRLAAILAVDLAGYSRQSESDEAGAVKTVEALGALVEAAVAERGGRIFNTAGDGFMAELPTASGALAAAQAIVGGADRRVRIGGHVGEVTVTPRGDLLGHGVNVACRLQVLALPGGILVSDALRRAIGGAPGPKLRRLGKVRLEKMQEVSEVYALSGYPGMKGEGVPRFWGLRLAIAAAVLAAIFAAILLLTPPSPRDLRVAVSPLRATTNGDVESWLAASLPGTMVTALSERNVIPVPLPVRPFPGLGGARMLVAGEVERQGDNVRVRLRLEDRRSDVILWSGVFERPVGEMDSLQAQVSAKVADLADLSRRALGDRANSLDPETLAAFLRVSDQQRTGGVNAVRSIDLHRRILKEAPDFALGHASLAFALALSAPGMSPAIAAEMRKEADREANIALKLDPKCGEAYSALFALAYDKPLVEREAILLKGLAAEPQNGNLNNYEADLLRGVGRLQEAYPYYTRALQLDPLSPAKAATSVFAMAGTGEMSDAEALLDRSLKLFPDYPGLGRAAVYAQAVYGRPDRALAAIDRFSGSGKPLDLAAADIWRDYVRTARLGNPDRAVLRRMADGVAADIIDPSPAMVALALAGDVDGAFRVIDLGLTKRKTTYPADLFEGATKPMRMDPRFMAVAARIGAADYWLATNKWPEFCADPDLPYECRAAAAQAVR